MTRRGSTEDGFTLVEMMVALFIFGLLAAAGVALLSVGVRAQAAATHELEATARLRRMSVLLANDMAQIVPRTARSGDGAVLRAFTGNDGTSNPLVMGYVRAGWSNPDGSMRAGVQRVDLVLSEGRLERHGYRSVDGTSPAAVIVLADNVSALSVRYRDSKGEYRPRWDNALLDSMPAAVELTVARARQKPVTMAFVAGPSYP
ncbi:MAG: type II secretion system minor pseudopilin GspJ [Sphingomonadales bacterium]